MIKKIHSPLDQIWGDLCLVAEKSITREEDIEQSRWLKEINWRCNGALTDLFRLYQRIPSQPALVFSGFEMLKFRYLIVLKKNAFFQEKLREILGQFEWKKLIFPLLREEQQWAEEELAAIPGKEQEIWFVFPPCVDSKPEAPLVLSHWVRTEFDLSA